MKKTIVTALVALLVMLAVSCDGIPGQKPEYDADGQELVTLSVSVGETEGSRSLIKATAQEEGNYVEVIFRRKNFPSAGVNTYYRAEAVKNTTILIKIPADTYAIDDAIVLYGTQGNKTLLATGVVTGVTGSTFTPNTSFVINTSTTKITFTLTALEADISPSATTSFVIVNDSGSPAIEDTLFDNNTTVNVSNAGVQEKWFQLPYGSDDIEAILTINGLDVTGASKNIIRSGTDSDSVKFMGPDGTNHPINPTVTFGADLPTPTPVALGTVATGVINLKFTTKFSPAPSLTHNGQYMIILDIPVVGFAKYVPEVVSPPTPAVNPSLSAAITWHIRGGIVPSQYDHTKNENEGIPLLVLHEPATDGIGIEILFP
jgi:hypothetical protein